VVLPGVLGRDARDDGRLARRETRSQTATDAGDCGSESGCLSLCEAGKKEKNMKYNIEFNQSLGKHVARADRHGSYPDWKTAREELIRLNAAPRPEPTPTAKSRTWESMDIDSGLGIGGIGSDDYNIHTETEPMNIVTGHSRSNGGGQLWEDCPRCGRQPVHLDCGYCDRHCRC
jgi:hypothetical protein